MASSTPLCGICEHQNTTKPAIVWCSDCDEGFCTDCSNHHRLAKTSRHHATTPIEDYLKLPSYVLEVEQFCKKHDEKFTHFCKQHDIPCCVTCSLHNHKKCQEITKINDVVQNIKSSYAFHEIDRNLSELAQNIPKILKDQRDKLVSLKNSKIQVEKEIKEFRVKLNNHLDKLEEGTIKELNKAGKTESKKIQKIVDDLGQKEKDINELHVNLSNIKQHASDLQAYLAMKKIQHDVDKTDTAIDSLINSDNLKHKILSLEINSAIKDFLSNASKYGNVVVNEKSCNVITRKKKNQQAQFLVPHRHITINDITLQLQQTLNINHDKIRGCCTLPDGRFVFTSYFNNKLIFMNTDSTHNTTLTIPPDAYDVVYVKYNNSLAVTSGSDDDNSAITFINIKNNKIKETIKLDSDCCYGIAEKGNTLFYCSDTSIYSLNLIDKTITKLKNFERVINSYIDIYENNLYHTNYSTDTVTCYNLSCHVKWEFKDVNIIRGPYGISVDNQGNVYVACSETHNVAVISPDGQKCRELLSNKDELHYPTPIHYDISTNNLLVANFHSPGFLYKVT